EKPGRFRGAYRQSTRMAGLREIIEDFRRAAVTEREKGTYFEELVLCYLRNEATYRDYYNKVWRYADWAEEQGLDKRDVGIDLVAQTAGTNEDRKSTRLNSSH